MTTKPLTEAEQELIGLRAPPLHPDGKPWTKCCKASTDTAFNCQCAVKKPRLAPRSRMENYRGHSVCPAIDTTIAQNGRFICCHRKTDDGYYRECAGWAAKYHPTTEKKS